MKKNFILFFLMMALSIHAQFRMNDGHSNLSQPDFTMVEKNSNGRIKSVRYAATDPNIPATAVDFFNSTCIKCKTDSFALDRFQETDYGMRFERYQQYFQGVLVDDGYYIFRFKNGKMKVVKGNCVNTTNINPQPSLTESEAIDSYASYLGVRKCDIIQSYVDLMVKEIPDTHRKGTTVSLTYRVYLRTFNITDCFVGYIDAHTGELLLKEKAYYSSSATGQFYTYYNRNLNDQPKSGITEYTNNKYYLADNTRGNGIHTYKQNQSGSTEFFSNNDNIWTRDELGDYNIALDVHWTMEQIYDLMNSQFSRNSYDGSGRLVKSYIDPLATNSYYIPILVPNSNDYSCTVYSNASFGCYLNATINCSGCTVTYSRYISGTSSPSSAGDDILRVIPLSENRYQISLSSRSDGKDKMVCIKVYDVKNLQTKIHDNFEKEDYIFETFSWKRGFYIIEITMGKKKYTTKLSVR